ncbi:sensor domain-containing diguanylate cyclase [Emcibacter sp. SYSU 3D8]|uniref:sensor domain-containing diguanylate cyclase n=1 Tax=Emcibacter sp. SYSU 3D8 TaxID=3133969 RepID=UPI0031FED471
MIELGRNALPDLIAMIEQTGQMGYWQLHACSDRISWSPQAYRIHGRHPAGGDISRHDALACLHADDRARVEDCLRAATEARENFETNARIMRPDGSMRYVKMAGRPLKGSNGEAADVIGILVDVSEFKRTENKLRRLAETDPLTGAANVRRFEAIALAELRRTARFGKQASIAIIDIDRFKEINDTFGHLVGDEVLRKFVQTMRGALREVDVVARIGGDEFAIMLPETTAAEAAIPLDRIAAVSRSLKVESENLTICLTFSSGISALTPGLDLREVLRSADSLLYQAKKAGTSGVETFTGELRKRVSS